VNQKKLLNLYGLKWNPFAAGLPQDGLVSNDKIDNFFFRVENLVIDGGYALITGHPGTGKSVILRMLAHRLSLMPEVRVGVFTRPQSGLPDFYREMGDLFGLELKVSNRWHSYKDLRKMWQDHINTSLFRPVLLVDEAQEVPAVALNELRLLASTDFDSKQILTVVLCGDTRLPDKFKAPDLIPLGSRIRVRLNQESASREEMMRFFDNLLEKAGNPKLITKGLKETLCDHSAGNYRVLINMANQLLDEALRQEADKIDEALFFQLFSLPKQSSYAGSKKKLA